MRRARLRPTSLGKNYIREWREHRGLTLEELASRCSMDKGNLSKIERSKAQFNQVQLEQIALELSVESATLLAHGPGDAEGLMDVWSKAQPGEREQIVRLAEAVIGYRAPDGTVR